ncbi:interferon-related developmental regulator-domain-containing protein [Whalleya microplaca]|nr:interferon-related developmental regulator-domain-containing protein [Whalleya microplaca]
MSDLRKQIFLESGKTISRKARSRIASACVSPDYSPSPSRGGSRANSRYASEEEDVSDSEDAGSLASSQLNSEEGEEKPGVDWDRALVNFVENILNDKRSSPEIRTHRLKAFANCVKKHPTSAWAIENQLKLLIPKLLKSARSATTSMEVIAALQALEVAVLSTESDVQYETVYARIFPVLKGVCEDSDVESVIVESIRALAVAAVCGGGFARPLMEFFLEIIESDGHVINSGDNGPIVIAALTCWGFVASNVGDLEEQSTQALEAFTEQLDSADVDVQIAAGEAIALLMEAAREYEAETDEPWNIQYDQGDLVRRVRLLTKESAKTISKRNRRQLHASFNSVLTSIERGLGPGYSTAHRMASNPHTGGTRTDFNDDVKEYGYREKVSFGNITMVVDSWALAAQIDKLKAVFGTNLPKQYMENPVVQELLKDGRAEFASVHKNKRSKRKSQSPPKARGGKGRDLFLD